MKCNHPRTLEKGTWRAETLVMADTKASTFSTLVSLLLASTLRWVLVSNNTIWESCDLSHVHTCHCPYLQGGIGLSQNMWIQYFSSVLNFVLDFEGPHCGYTNICFDHPVPTLKPMGDVASSSGQYQPQYWYFRHWGLTSEDINTSTLHVPETIWYLNWIFSFKKVRFLNFCCVYFFMVVHYPQIIIYVKNF